VIALVVMIACAAPTALGDVGFGPPVGVTFGNGARFGARLHAQVASESGSWAFTVRSVVKVGTVRIGELRPFTGTATTRVRTIPVTVDRSLLAKVRHAAPRQRAHHVVVRTIIRYRPTAGGTAGWTVETTTMLLPHA